MNEITIRSFYQGLRQGVQMYAHWRDGVQYVGTTGKTLRDAIKHIDELEEKDLKELNEHS
jgi:hypothetical protein